MIIYIHGLGSTGEGDKYHILKDMFPDIQIYSPTYDSLNFDTIDGLLDGIELDGRVLFIGNSLGGFVAMYLAKKYNSKCILLNPSTDPVRGLTKSLELGNNKLPNSNNILTHDNINKLNKYYIDIEDVSISVFVNLDDDIIKPTETFDYFLGIRPVIINKVGGHRFNNLKNIKEDIYFLYNQI